MPRNGFIPNAFYLLAAFVWLSAMTVEAQAQTSEFCGPLNTELAAEQRARGALPENTGAGSQIARQLAQARNDARAAGCLGGLFNFRRPHPACPAILSTMARLQGQLRGSGGGFWGSFPRASTPSYREWSIRQELVRRGCPIGQPTLSSTRTMCVRVCDGYYFPISTAAGKKAIARDEGACMALYPEGQAKLFLDRTRGERPELMVSVAGEKYREQPFAFAFQQSFNAACPRAGAVLASVIASPLQQRHASASGGHELRAISRSLRPVAASLDGAATIRTVGPRYVYRFPDKEDDGLRPTLTAEVATVTPLDAVSVPIVAGETILQGNPIGEAGLADPDSDTVLAETPPVRLRDGMGW